MNLTYDYDPGYELSTWQNDSGGGVQDTLSGKHLRVLMLEYPPFLFIDYDEYGNKSYRGICWDLINTLSEALNFTFELDQSKDGKWGNKDPVTGWFGIQGEVFRGEADLGMPITITPERTPAFDFSFSFWQEPCGTVVRLESDASPSLWFLRPLSRPVWLSYLSAYIVLTLCLWLFPRVSPRPQHSPHAEKPWTLAQTFWFTYGIIFRQGSKLKRDWVWRSIAIGWWYTTLILIDGVFVGNLVAFLATTQYTPPFNTLKEMAAQSQYVYGTEKGIFIEKMFQDAKSGTYKEIGEYITEHPDSFTFTTTTGIERAMTSRYAFMGEYSVLDASIVDYCNLTLMKEQFYIGRWAFEMKKGWKHKEELDDAIMRVVEAGLITKWVEKHWPVSQCRGQGTFAEVSSVSLQGFVTVFALLIAGVGIAFGVLLLEIMYRSRK